MSHRNEPSKSSSRLTSVNKSQTKKGHKLSTSKNGSSRPTSKNNDNRPLSKDGGRPASTSRDDESRPTSKGDNRVSSSTSKGDNRVSSSTSSMFGSAHIVNRRLLDSPTTAMQVLPSEDFSDQDSDLDIEDIDDGSDEFSEDELKLLSSSVSSSKHQQQQVLSGDEEFYLNKQLVLPGFDKDEEEVDVDSEEEKAIVKEIKEEIKRQVKEEMKSELAIYEKPTAASEESGNKEDDLADVMDPDLKEAILKMRKYDRILKKKMKREKEVKKDRLRLQKRLRAELEALKNESEKTEAKEESSNTAKFLALEPPPSHSEGIIIESDEDEEDDVPVTPVFRTQPPDLDITDNPSEASQSSRKSKNSAAAASSRKSASTNDPGSRAGDSSTGSRAGDSSRASSTRKGNKKKKDFIKRNIKLASDAGNVIAMTDDEKNRLEDLLKNIDTEDVIPEEAMDNEAMLDIALPPGIGYRPEIGEEHQLRDIDSRLKALLPPEEFSVYTAQVTTNPLEHCLFTRTDIRNVDIDELGEKILKETKEQREMRLRLEQIESELGQLSQHKDLVVETPKLSEEMLDSLLDECCRSLSRTTLNTSTSEPLTARSTSSRISLLENPPVLPPDILEDLLAEARAEQGSAFAQQILDAAEDSDENLSDFNNGSNSSVDLNESDEAKANRMNNRLQNNARNDEDDNLLESLTDDQLQLLFHKFTNQERSNSRQSSAGHSRRSSAANRNILTQHNELNRSKSSNEQVKLPEINRSGSLVSQLPSNNQRNSLNNANQSLSVTDTSQSFNGVSQSDADLRDSVESNSTGETVIHVTHSNQSLRGSAIPPRSGRSSADASTHRVPHRPDTEEGRNSSRRSVNYKSRNTESQDNEDDEEW